MAATNSEVDSANIVSREGFTVIFFRAMGSAPIVFALLACNQPQQAQIAEIAELKETVKRLEENITTLQVESFSFKMRQEQYDNANFDPAEGKGYGKVETTSGYFLVSLQEVTPHLDGVKVKLHVGNSQFATYNGFTIVAEYGRRFPKYDKKIPLEERQKLLAAYEVAKRNKSETFTQVLRPGTWNVVYLTLADIKPENFGSLTLSIATSQVSLSSGR